MKKLVSIFLALVMILAISVPVFAAESTTLTINGVSETRNAERNGALYVEAKDGSAIGGGNIIIQNIASLTAEANGNNAFGIGGENANVTIDNTTIDYVCGGHIQALFVNDLKYGKSEPEGGAAIGGATITIKDKIANILLHKLLVFPFGNLLLLETKDWNENGVYLPNDEAYDFTFLVRMNPYCEDILRTRRLLYSDTVDFKELYAVIGANSWGYDIPGFVTLEDLKYVIKNNFVLPQGSMLNGRTRMDAENYYIQSGDMRSIDEFLGGLQNEDT